MIKTVLRSVLALILLLLLWQHQLLLYGISQAKGQLKVISKSREIPDVLSDPLVADSIKYKLRLIQEIKQFAVDQLGFEETENYSTYYDQHGKPSLWVVTAAKPFKLEPKEWYFPILGKVPYKGFFVYQKAVEEERKLERRNWDTNIRVAEGWSTLGWFRDPVLSNMLNDIPGELANTIIHELTHSNLFVKDSIEFNENLATFFGDQGARRFLEYKFGLGSFEYKANNRAQSDRMEFTDHILRGADRLGELYSGLGETMAENLRYGPKRQLIETIIEAADTLNLHQQDRYIMYLKTSKVNNAFFMSYLRYRSDLSFFEEELRANFNGDLKRYFHHIKNTYSGS